MRQVFVVAQSRGDGAAILDVPIPHGADDTGAVSRVNGPRWCAGGPPSCADGPL